MDSVVVLFSGGVDSTVLVTIAERSNRLAAAVFVDYGQPAVSQERVAAQRWSGLNRARLVEVKASIFGSEAALAIGAGKSGPRVVPCRNLILLSMAAGVAISLGAREVWYGATAADQADYPDCRPVFAAALSRVLALEGGVSAHAPLSGMRRQDVVSLGRALGVSFVNSWSCYEPIEGRPCGACNSCMQDHETEAPHG
jgi:7-cyano-7-deazaguanine synthase